MSPLGFDLRRFTAKQLVLLLWYFFLRIHAEKPYLSTPRPGKYAGQHNLLFSYCLTNFWYSAIHPAPTIDASLGVGMVGGVKTTFIALLAFSLCLSVFTGCQTPQPNGTPEPPKTTTNSGAGAWVSDPDDPNNVKIEAAIRYTIIKPKGELTKADLEKVARLNLEGTNITDAGLKELAKLKQLGWLNLDRTKITDAGLKELAKLKQLGLLSLRDTNMTNAGLKELGKMKNLTHLYLSGTQITDAGLKEVAKLENLTELELQDIQITDAGLKEIAKLQQLKSLNLIYTKITDAGLKDVAKLQKLTELRLRDTQITDAGLKEVAKLQQLKSLQLNSTKVTKAGVAQLQKALPKCEIYGP